jgi:hypothetical protein
MLNLHTKPPTANQFYRLPTMVPTTSKLVSDSPTVHTGPMDFNPNAAPHLCDPGEKAGKNNPEIANAHEWTLLLKLSTAASTGNVNIVKIHRSIFDLLHSANPNLYFKIQSGSTVTNVNKFPKGSDYKTTFQHKETGKQFIVAHTVRSLKAATGSNTVTLL